MIEQPAEHVVEVSEVSHRATTFTDFTYYTGGLVSTPVADGEFGLGPFQGAEDLQFALFPSEGALTDVIGSLGLRAVGTNRSIHDGAGPSMEIWIPRTSIHEENGADTWAAISNQAQLSKNGEYAALARYVAVSMLAAGIRLRDVAKCHHEQLKWALMANHSAAAGFTNVQLLDLYVAFHSLVSELCTARDHLARIAALHIGAKESVDNMARLEEWLKKGANSHHMAEPMTKLLIATWGAKETPGWLRKLGDIRNQMVHRQPLAANPDAAMLRLRETITPTLGIVKTIRLAPSPSNDKDLSSIPDPFETLLELSDQMQQLATDAGKLARYKPILLTFKSKSSQ